MHETPWICGLAQEKILEMTYIFHWTISTNSVVWLIYPLLNFYITKWNDPPFWMGQFSILTGQFFHSYVTNYQRVDWGRIKWGGVAMKNWHVGAGKCCTVDVWSEYVDTLWCRDLSDMQPTIWYWGVEAWAYDNFWQVIAVQQALQLGTSCGCFSKERKAHCRTGFVPD